MADLIVAGLTSSVTTPDDAYCTVDELKTYLNTEGTGYDSQLTMAVSAASRAIDSYCGRRFWLDDTPVARTFVPCRIDRIDLDDIGSTTGLIIKTDEGGDGTFENTWASTDYELTPVNAPYASPEAKPWTGLRCVGSRTLPWLINTSTTRLDRLQVTALWGWPAVPSTVRQAALIKAARLFHRRNSPTGVVAFDEFGAVRITRGIDSDVAEMLEEYRKTAVLIA